MQGNGGAPHRPITQYTSLLPTTAMVPDVRPGSPDNVSDNLASPTMAARREARKLLTEEPDSLEDALRKALPDKEQFFRGWLQALAAPNVCVSSLEDVRRLDAVDISSLPVPPLVKRVFRDILAQQEDVDAHQRFVLDATTARATAFLERQKDRNMNPSLNDSKYFQDHKNYRLILTKEELEAAVRIVAKRIENWSKGERVVLVGILKGAFMFMSDLCRALTRPYSVFFVEASSYADSREQGSAVAINSELASAKFCDAMSRRPHKVVIVDELLDNGKTMLEMKQHFLRLLGGTHGDNDILTCCLMSKKRERDCPEADITGIPDLPDLWLVGYGLDDRGTKRGWDNLFAIPKVKIVYTHEQQEVEKLLANLDEDAKLISTTVFAGFELTSTAKQRFRVFGVDIITGEVSMKPSELQNATKAELVRAVNGVQVVKGKYEHELQIAFIQDGVHLVPEDAIFSGDTKVFAEMRCRYLRYVRKEARRFNVEGPGQMGVV